MVLTAIGGTYLDYYISDSLPTLNDAIQLIYSKDAGAYHQEDGFVLTSISREGYAPTVLGLTASIETYISNSNAALYNITNGGGTIRRNAWGTITSITPIIERDYDNPINPETIPYDVIKYCTYNELG